MEPLEIVDNPIVRDRFIQIYDTLWGAAQARPPISASVFFNRLLRDTENGKLQTATRFSIFTAFIDLAVIGLSLEPGSRALCYLMGRNVNAAQRPTPMGRPLRPHSLRLRRARPPHTRRTDTLCRQPRTRLRQRRILFRRPQRPQICRIRRTPTPHRPQSHRLLPRYHTRRRLTRLRSTLRGRLAAPQGLFTQEQPTAQRPGEVYGSANALYSSGDDGAIDPASSAPNVSSTLSSHTPKYA